MSTSGADIRRGTHGQFCATCDDAGRIDNGGSRRRTILRAPSNLTGICDRGLEPLFTAALTGDDTHR